MQGVDGAAHCTNNGVALWKTSPMIVEDKSEAEQS